MHEDLTPIEFLRGQQQLKFREGGNRQKYMEMIIRRFAGIFILVSLLLAYLHSLY